MLYGESEGARHASIQCLSQLILKPEDGDKHEADRTNVHHDDTEPWEKHLLQARRILSEQPYIWIKILYDLLDSKDQGEETLGASCLSRFVKIDSVRDDFLKNRRLCRFIKRLVHLLKRHHAPAHAASALGSMSTGKKDMIFLDQSSKMLRRLMRMIKSKNPQSKRAGVVCLSECFVNDGVMRKLVLQRQGLLVDLMKSLFRP
ncbi:hypothetical protein IW261DRAFT_1534220 [Armillaria novae-zelandiae]|uniref:Uncharacterized protein n=1 Tax=Armillaria novae-zelandiae TaxID=153914 RepID=A0AA39KFN8_9AGAR|nr:hypothetical protein IW261DRAFT_1534220 [Armillaria novae-zelandiae]